MANPLKLLIYFNLLTIIKCDCNLVNMTKKWKSNLGSNGTCYLNYCNTTCSSINFNKIGTNTNIILFTKDDEYYVRTKMFILFPTISGTFYTRFSGYPNSSREDCRSYTVLRKTDANLVYLFPRWVFESQTDHFMLEYGARKFIFRVPYFERHRKSTPVEKLEIFSYLDIADPDWLHLKVQLPKPERDVRFEVNLWRGPDQLVATKLFNQSDSHDGEIAFSYPKFRDPGDYYFTVAPLCNGCLATPTPSFKIEHESAPLSALIWLMVLLIAILGLLVISTRKFFIAKRDIPVPRLLFIYRPSADVHNRAIASLKRLLVESLKIDVMLDVEDIPKTRQNDPLLWCNQAVTAATHLIFIAPPSLNVISKAIYAVDGLGFRLIREELLENNSEKKVLTITFPYSSDNVPEELTLVKQFRMMSDFKAFVHHVTGGRQKVKGLDTNATYLELVELLDEAEDFFRTSEPQTLKKIVVPDLPPTGIFDTKEQASENEEIFASDYEFCLGDLNLIGDPAGDHVTISRIPEETVGFNLNSLEL